jgi:hypothetical protein
VIFSKVAKVSLAADIIAKSTSLFKKYFYALQEGIMPSR